MLSNVGSIEAITHRTHRDERPFPTLERMSESRKRISANGFTHMLFAYRV